MRKYKKTNNKGMSAYTKEVIILLVIILILSTVLLIKMKKQKDLDSKRQMEISNLLNTIHIPTEDLEEVKTERMLQVSELRKENKDVVGWLEVEGTNINYPVCKTNNNEYYLNHSYDGKENSYGSIFLDKDFSFILPSDNLLIYRT